MKKHILAIVLIISTFGIYAQERVNRVEHCFEQRRSEKLTKATGWMFNERTGKWVENQNYYSWGGGREYWADQEKRYGKEDADRYQINDRARATSFEYLQFLTLKIDTTLYYVLKQIKWEGHWHYPKIREKWYQFIGVKSTYLLKPNIKSYYT